jgi:UrcA family protein
MKTINYWKNATLATVTGLGLASFAVAAHADDYEIQTTARTVHYSDLDLNTQAGVDALHHRIQKAAEQVCGDVDARQLVESAAAQACVNRAVSAGVRAVNSQRVASLR